MAKTKAFFKKLREHPNDDAPRLAFAEWLQANGNNECAEFIRLQIALEPLRNRWQQPEVMSMLHRERQMLNSIHEIWEPAFDVLCESAKLNYLHYLAEVAPTFQRGFPRAISVDLVGFLNAGAEFLAALPTVVQLSVHGIDPAYFEHLFDLPGFDRMRVLELMEPLRPGYDMEYHRTFDAMCKTSLRVLRLLGCPTGAPLHMMLLLDEKKSSVRIELVQLESHGMTAGYGGEANSEYDQIANNLGTIFDFSANDGRSATPRARVIRPHDGRFILDGVLNEYLVAGRTKSGDPALAGTNEYRTWHIARFGSDGRFIGEVDHNCPRGISRMKYLIDDLGFQPGAVTVSEFQTSEGMCLNLWPQNLWYREIQPLLNGGYTEGTSTGGSTGNRIREWLARGQFALSWSEVDYIGDGIGSIQSSSLTP